MTPKEQDEQRLDYTDILIIDGWIISLALLFPLLCCTIDKFVFNFSIGPVVFFYLPATIITMFGVVFWTAGTVVGHLVGFIAAIPLGIFLGVIFHNYFIMLTSLFDVMDYHLM